MNKAKRQIAKQKAIELQLYRAKVKENKAIFSQKKVDIFLSALNRSQSKIDIKELLSYNSIQAIGGCSYSYNKNNHPAFGLFAGIPHTYHKYFYNEFKQLLKAVYYKAPKLFTKEYIPALHLLSWVEWERNVEDWKPQGKSGETQFNSLCRHLLARYNMPDFIWSAFLFNNEQYIPFVEFVAKGGSVYNAIQKGLLPVPLTRKMCHELMRTKSNYSIVKAIRRVQVKAFGGNDYLLKAIMATHVGESLSFDSVEWEKFWATVFQWLCNNYMFNHSQISPMFDYLTFRHNNDPKFSIKGRTVDSVINAMNAWHDNLRKSKDVKNIDYKPSGLKSGCYIDPSNDEIGGSGTINVIEILSGKELMVEGAKMHHCVLSYSDYIVRGTCSIWSMRKGQSRLATIEVRGNIIVQCRGFANRHLTNSQYRVLLAWAKDNCLSIGKWL